MGSHADAPLWPYYFWTVALALVGSTLAVLLDLTTFAVLWTSGLTAIAVAMGTIPALRPRPRAWLARRRPRAARGWSPRLPPAPSASCAP